MLEKMRLFVYADVSPIMKTMMKSMLIDNSLDRLYFAYHCPLH